MSQPPRASDTPSFSAAAFKKPQKDSAQPRPADDAAPGSSRLPRDASASSALGNAEPDAQPGTEPETVSEDDITEVPPAAATTAPSETTDPGSKTSDTSDVVTATDAPPAELERASLSSPPENKAALDDTGQVESSSVGASVADVDVATALRQARRGRKTQIAVTLGAAAIIVVGAGLGMHQQSGPDVRSSKADPIEAPEKPQPPAPKAAAPAPPPKAEPEPSAAPAPEPEPAAPVSVILRVHPLGAHIFEGTKKIAHTAVTLKVLPDEKKTLNLYLDGYWPRQVVVDASKPEVNVSMKRKDGEAVTPTAASTASAASQKAAVTAPSAQNKPKKAQTSQATSAEGELLPAL